MSEPQQADSKIGSSVPVSAAIISVADLDKSLEFYAGTLGLEVSDSGTLDSEVCAGYWRAPAGVSARFAFLGYGADPVGRILLQEFSGGERRQIRMAGVKRAIGLFNLNIYSSDVRRDYQTLSEQGFEFWSEPNHINFGPAVGEALEFAFEGPDGVVINLVELLSKDEQSMIGHLWHFVNGYGRTPTGFTPVATTAHTVLDMQKALDFYYGPLGMTTFSDAVIENEAANRMANLPADARTHSVLVQGDHEYGKVALAAPLNYEVASLVPDAVAPNIGYLAQSFAVRDLDETAAACAAIGAEIYSATQTLTLPGRGECRAMLLRNPGSGALQELYAPV